jgi:hypothetical protein
MCLETGRHEPTERAVATLYDIFEICQMILLAPKPEQTTKVDVFAYLAESRLTAVVHI